MKQLVSDSVLAAAVPWRASVDALVREELVYVLCACCAPGSWFVRTARTFAVAFWSLGANWALLVGRDRSDEYTPYFYLLRLFAFVLILLAIVDNNRRTSRSD